MRATRRSACWTLDPGCTSTPAPLELRANLDGTRLLDLDPECAAALVGLKPGDVLVQVNGKPVTNAPECYAAIHDTEDGRLRLEFTRDGAELSIDAAIPKLERIRFAWNA